jgi:N-acetyl-gamma-glutamyl-phosphate reductase
MVKVGIIGATGYAGAEIIRILAKHPEAQIVWVGSRSFAGQDITSIYGNLFHYIDLSCIDDDTEKMKAEILQLADSVDVIFTATPQGACAGFVSEELLKKVKIIDLSADFRLSDIGVYEHWYKMEHKSPQLLSHAVYGLSELYRDRIRKTQLLANPGCFTTCSILTAYPLVKEGLIDTDTLIIDALSGVSGAGRGAKIANLFCEVNENAKAYGVTTHRHTPEIEEQLGKAAAAGISGSVEDIAPGQEKKLTLQFTPHLVPMNRGILATEYASLVQNPDGSWPSEESLRAVYEKYYGGEKFIRFLPAGAVPETRFVEGSNCVDINIKTDPRTHRVIMMGALDNLVKGAAGQAVQNMNLMFGLPEDAGLDLVPCFP